jgi:putative transcriptional regulator
MTQELILISDDLIPKSDQFMPEKIKVNRIKTILADKDISHKDFAKMVGKSPNTITRICNNEQQPSLIFLRQMAFSLDVDISELLIPTKLKR